MELALAATQAVLAREQRLSALGGAGGGGGARAGHAAGHHPGGHQGDAARAGARRLAARGRDPARRPGRALPRHPAQALPLARGVGRAPRAHEPVAADRGDQRAAPPRRRQRGARGQLRGGARPSSRSAACPRCCTASPPSWRTRWTSPSPSSRSPPITTPSGCSSRCATTARASRPTCLGRLGEPYVTTPSERGELAQPPPRHGAGLLHRQDAAGAHRRPGGVPQRPPRRRRGQRPLAAPPGRGAARRALAVAVKQGAC